MRVLSRVVDLQGTIVGEAEKWFPITCFHKQRVFEISFMPQLLCGSNRTCFTSWVAGGFREELPGLAAVVGVADRDTVVCVHTRTVLGMITEGHQNATYRRPSLSILYHLAEPIKLTAWEL